MGAQAGDVLIAGGDSGGVLGPFHLATSTVSSTAAQVYNPTTDAFTLLTGLNTPRESAVPVVLPNGLTLIVGGETCAPSSYSATSGFLCTALNTAELYNESTGLFTFAGSGSGGTMTTPRMGPTATLISGSGTGLDGQVLIVGGSTATRTCHHAARKSGSDRAQHGGVVQPGHRRLHRDKRADSGMPDGNGASDMHQRDCLGLLAAGNSESDFVDQ